MLRVTSTRSPPTDEEIQAAARNWASWVSWYMAEFRERVPTRVAMADLMGVTSEALHYQLKAGSRRLPTLPLLMGASRVIGAGIDVMLFTPHPPAVSRK